MKKALLALSIVALATFGCGGDAATEADGGGEEFALMLDYFPNADHASIYAAEANDRFDEAGLDLAIREPSDPAAPIKQVAAGRVDLAISYEPEVLRARDQGVPVKAVATLVGEPLTSIVSLPDAGVESPADLADKTVGTAGIDYQDAFLDTILDEAGVDPGSVERRNLGFNLSQGLVTGKADAVLGAFWNYEAIELEQNGRDPRVIHVEDAGVPTYSELVLVASDERIAGDPESIRAFITALGAGTNDLEDNPEAALEALLDANPELDRELQSRVVDVTAPLFAPPEGKPYGYIDGAAWEEFGRFMTDAGLIDENVAREAQTSELLE